MACVADGGIVCDRLTLPTIRGVPVILVHPGTVTVLDIPYHPFRPSLSGLSMTHPELDCIERSVDGVMELFGCPDAHVASAYSRNL